MPRAVLGAQSVPEAALSVTEVSKRLGVSASTLRTWERRYGVGPEERAAGAHRRYLPDDVERLRAMIGLVRNGMPTGQAAAAVHADRARPDRGAPVRPAELRVMAESGEAPALQEAL